MTTSSVSPSSSRSFSISAKDLAAHRGVEAADRLVGDHDLRIECQRPSDDDALTLTTRQLVRVAQEEPLRRS